MKNLKDEIVLANDSIPVEKITEATWFTRELAAFENFNAGKKHNQEFLTYLFADWLIRAYFKYEKQDKYFYDEISFLLASVEYKFPEYNVKGVLEWR